MCTELIGSPDIFVFCLSTRAGGLGINLTAADTVVFCKCNVSFENKREVKWKEERKRGEFEKRG
jgi:hypothetical protein